MNPKYKFLIRKGSQSATATEIHPVWKDDLSLEYQKESQQQFFRANLSGSIDLQRDDYTYVMSEAFGTVFYLEIQISDNGASWSHYWWGKFTLTDCKVNVDDHILTVKPEVVDQYTDIMAGMEKEFDLIKLAPVIDQVRIHKRPCIQIFNRASETVTCICGNLSWEQDASLPSEDIAQFLVDHCHFFPISSPVEIRIPSPPVGYETAFSTPFTGQLSPQGAILTNQANTFYIEYWVTPLIIGGYVHGLNVISRAQGDTRWKWEEVVPYEVSPLPTVIKFVTQTSQTVDMEGITTDMGLYSRVVLNTTTYDGQDTLRIYPDDVLAYNRNYRYALQYDARDLIVNSSNTQVSPTEYGKRESDGEYYLPPNTPYDKYIPIGKNLWGSESVWIQKTSDYKEIEEYGTYTFDLKDAFPLWSCISVILGEIAPSITFAGNQNYSEFLYSGFDPIQGRDNTLYLTPKSNITNGEYQTPAQTAPVTLKDILTMLKNVFKCYWFIDTNNRLRIEHISWFMNGGSYYYQPSVGINLNTMVNKRNGKSWAYGLNSYEYEKPDMPERYQFGWMDDVTLEFKGQPIEVLSSFVQQGKVEEINIANFTSDMDYMMLNPGAISPDGFALLNVLTDPDDGTLYVPVVTFYTGTYNWRAQNGWLSFHALQWAYWKFDMPAYSLNIEGDPYARASSVQKGKKQQVTIPLGLTDPNLMQLVATGLGNGQIQQVSIRLTSRMAKTQLRYDTE